MRKPVILITGATSSIGREVIRALAGEDVKILAHGNRGQVAPLTGDSIRAEVVPLRADLADVGQIADLIRQVEETVGHPDRILLLPAAPLRMERFADFDFEHFERDLRIQLTSALKLLSAFLPRMQRAKVPGKVVFVLSSVTLGVPPQNMTAYVTAKHAMLGLMRALAAEYAGVGISINAVSPSMIETPFLNGVPHKIVEVAAARHPLRRNAIPADLVPLIGFLLSPASGYISGANIPVTGGAVA